MIDWVEKGIAPDTLEAASVPLDPAQPVTGRILCPYTQVAAYVGGDETAASSFKCAESFSVGKRLEEL